MTFRESNIFVLTRTIEVYKVITTSVISIKEKNLSMFLLFISISKDPISF